MWRIVRTDSAETADWVRRQNVCTKAVLDKCDLQPLLLKRMTEQYDYAKLSVPFQRGDRFFVFKLDGLQNQPVLWTSKTAEGLYTSDAKVWRRCQAQVCGTSDVTRTCRCCWT